MLQGRLAGDIECRIVVDKDLMEVEVSRLANLGKNGRTSATTRTLASATTELILIPISLHTDADLVERLMLYNLLKAWPRTTRT